jgi:hypothetical protein
LIEAEAMANPQPEPSMEEILASIRRIISEDEDEPTAKAEPTRPAPAPPAAPAPKAEATRPAPAAPAMRAPEPPRPAATPQPVVREDDRASRRLATEDVEMIKKSTAEAIIDREDTIIDDTTAAAASSAFRSLSATVRVNDAPGRSLEDIVVEMLRPMIKDWLDQNLAGIVEEKVEEEIQRVARRRR